MAVFIPGLAVAVRRFHDIGKSGKLLLLLYVALIALFVVMLFSGLSVFMSGMNPEGMSPAGMGALGIGFFIPLLLIIAICIYILVLLFTKGNDGPNKYGPDPKGVGEEINEIGLE